jgi:UDP-glucose 4-epimerase
MRNAMVSGAHTPLGRQLLERLRRCDGLERIVGVEAIVSSKHSPRHANANRNARAHAPMEGIELVTFDDDHRGLLEFLISNHIDTLLHCDMAPDRTGDPCEALEAKVIDTMRLGAAIAHDGSPVQSWVVASSTAVYPSSSQAPLLVREDGAVDAPEGTLAASILEAEDYARDVAVRRPHLNVAILRLQQLVGVGIHSPISALLRQPILPSLLGFDASLQLLSIEDAVRALEFAARLELAGIYNVASVGTIRMSNVARELDRFAFPLIPLEFPWLAPLARRLGVPHVPKGMLELLCFGNAVDTAKLAGAGFEPQYDQAACLATLRD